MTAPPTSTLQADLAAALDWWRMAGIEHDLHDEASGLLGEPEPEPDGAPAAAPVAEPHAQPAAPARSLRPAAPAVPRIDADRSQWPDSLAAFQQWFAGHPGLDSGGAYPAVPPRGNAGAELLVLVEQPEAEDTTALLSGPQGRLIGGFLRAAGIAADKAYFAAVLRRHTPLADWGELSAAGAGTLTAHHLSLAAPKRILALGRNILPLFGNDTAQGAAVLPEFNHQGGTIPILGPILGAPSPEELQRSASRRARLWQQWLDWTDG